MRWEKRGLVFRPSGEAWWARTHAYLPTAEVREDRIRVYFAGLDDQSVGRIGYVDLDLADPSRILGQSADPILDVGSPGTFDDSGVNASCIIDDGGDKRMYYIGWQKSVRVPYALFAGIAVSHDGGESYERVMDVPVLDRTHDERFVRSATTIVRAGTGYAMWYVSADEWIDVDGKPVPKYLIRRADSKDGLEWQVAPGVAIDHESEEEYGFGRPWVFRYNSIYHMWYSIRSRTQPYRIGYAHSQDGHSWVRDDANVGIAASSDGWDSEMICFPCVVEAGDRVLMFYNGNGHGKSGFGYAELVTD